MLKRPLPAPLPLLTLPDVCSALCAALGRPWVPGEPLCDSSMTAHGVYKIRVETWLWDGDGRSLFLQKETGDNRATSQQVWTPWFLAQAYLTGLPGETMLTLEGQTWGAAELTEAQAEGPEAERILAALLAVLSQTA